jgi:hypothetical protein
MPDELSGQRAAPGFHPAGIRPAAGTQPVQPEAEHSAVYQLMGPDYTVDANRKRVSRLLDIDGHDTGVKVEVRADGAAIGFTPDRLRAPHGQATGKHADGRTRWTTSLWCRPADYIVDGLRVHEVDTVFGIPGVQTYELFDSLARAGEQIRVIGAGRRLRAFGYAQATGPFPRRHARTTARLP